MSKTVNKDGTANKVYVRKMWNFVMDTACDGFNGNISDNGIKKRIKQFEDMADTLVAESEVSNEIEIDT